MNQPLIDMVLCTERRGDSIAQPNTSDIRFRQFPCYVGFIHSVRRCSLKKYLPPNYKRNLDVRFRTRKRHDRIHDVAVKSIQDRIRHGAHRLSPGLEVIFCEQTVSTKTWCVISDNSSQPVIITVQSYNGASISTALHGSLSRHCFLSLYRLFISWPAEFVAIKTRSVGHQGH